MTDPKPVIIVIAGAVLQNGKHGELPLTANFVYNPDDPMAVSMTLILDVELPCGDMATTQNTWVYSRDLLDVALSRLDRVPIGAGDVTVTYLVKPDVVRIELTDVQGDKHALFVDAEPVYDFMEQSLRVIPAHKEKVDVDAAIHQLLDGTWQS